MAESLIKQMEELNLVSEEVLRRDLEIELNFCLGVKNCFANWSQFDQEIVFTYAYGKVTIQLFILSERRLNKSDANKLCYIAEKCFDEFNTRLPVLGWCVIIK